MSHPTAWTCRSCRFVLGQVRDGVLRPLVPVEAVDGRGVARVPCPRCGVSCWSTASSAAAPSGWRPTGSARCAAWEAGGREPGRSGLRAMIDAVSPFAA